jgi:8-oxo-dGTP pyrophosphatase MutT (NUDIX family)
MFDSAIPEDNLAGGGGKNRPVYETPWLDFYYDDFTHPNGDSGKYAWIMSHSGDGGVMVIPVTPSEKYLLIKVYRHPAKRYLWEFPAGVMEVGEEPMESGRRELIEETGITPENIVLLGSQVLVGGITGWKLHAMVGEIPEISIDDVTPQADEGIVDAKLLTRQELIEFLMDEEVGEGVTLGCLARYWMYLELKEGGDEG